MNAWQQGARGVPPVVRRHQTEIGGPPGDITLERGGWETWTVGQLLDLVDELGQVRCGSWQLVGLASDSHSRYRALEQYTADLEREIAAYRALGELRLLLAPDGCPTAAEYHEELAAADVDEDAARRAMRIEYVLGCELAGISPNESDVPDPGSVTPREGS